MRKEMREVLDRMNGQTVEARTEYVTEILDFFCNHFEKAENEGEQIIACHLMAKLEEMLFTKGGE